MERRIFLRALGLGVVGAVAAPKVFDLFVPDPLTETTFVCPIPEGARILRKNMVVTVATVDSLNASLKRIYDPEFFENYFRQQTPFFRLMAQEGA